ncbi:MAG: 2-dehydropantoate 2-reductase [Thermodesulfobacteriota bacterium]
MLHQETSVAVIGAGAIGGITAAYLGKAGWDVELVCKHQQTVDRVASSGLRVFGIRGEDVYRVKAVRQIADLSSTKDVVLLATKADACVEAAQEALPFLRDTSVLVSLQNGISEYRLAEIAGRERVIGCVVGWGATMHGPGELEMTSEGEFVVGNIDHKPDSRLPRIQEMLSAVVPTRISENIMGELYSKLIVNSCINSLGAITGLPLGKLLAIRKARNLFIRIMEEAIHVADAMGLRVEPGGGGKLDFYRFLGSTSLSARFKQHVTIRAIGFKYRRIRSSSLQSLERGRKTEVDFLNGYITHMGRVHGIPTPVNDALVTIIKEIESGSRPISPQNLHDTLLGLQ